MTHTVADLLLSHQRPNVGEYHIHKLRHKSVKSGGAVVGRAGSIEDESTAYTLLKAPSTSSLTADSDNDAPTKSPAKSHDPAVDLTAGKLHLSTDSEPLSDDFIVAPPTSGGKKTVAINTAQVDHFTHRLLPVQSPEFDNVMDQVMLSLSLSESN